MTGLRSCQLGSVDRVSPGSIPVNARTSVAGSVHAGGSQSVGFSHIDVSPSLSLSLPLSKGSVVKISSGKN